jgi:hypothetical protein
MRCLRKLVAQKVAEVMHILQLAPFAGRFKTTRMCQPTRWKHCICQLPYQPFVLCLHAKNAPTDTDSLKILPNILSSPCKLSNRSGDFTDYVTWHRETGRKHGKAAVRPCFLTGSSVMKIRNSNVGCRETLFFLALAIVPAVAGCQSSGSENGSAWDWGAKTPPPTTTNSSPFSAAATYNRNNNPSGMGFTLYDGPAHAKPAAPQCDPPGPLPNSSGSVPSSGTTAPAGGGLYFPPGNPNPGPNAFPQGPAPGMAGPAPTGYWIYQPANGNPAAYPNGAPLLIPVYGPPAGGLPGNARAMSGGGPSPPSLPAQTGAYPPNYPANFSEPRNPPPPDSPAGTAINPQRYAAPAAGNQPGVLEPLYVPGSFASGPAAGRSPVPGKPGELP